MSADQGKRDRQHCCLLKYWAPGKVLGRSDWVLNLPKPRTRMPSAGGPPIPTVPTSININVGARQCRRIHATMPQRSISQEGPSQDHAEQQHSLLEDASDAESESDHHPAPTTKSTFQRNVILCAIVFFFAELFELSLFAPVTAILERSICLTYYFEANPSLIDDQGSVPEQSCKVHPVQAELATVKAWKAMLDCVPSL